MAKKTFTDGDPQQQIPGTVVNAAWLNKIGYQVPTGEDIDGSTPLLSGADTGIADAYVLDMTFGPELIVFPQAYVQGLRLSFKASVGNTGASTLDVNSLGAITIKKYTDQDLEAGDIKAGQIVLVEYDGANFQIISPVETSFVSIRDLFRNLILKTTGDNTLDVDADEVILQDANGLCKRIAAINLTINMANQWLADSSVKDGRGIGIADSVSIWYYIWIVNGSSGTGIVATTESTLAGALADVGTGYNTYGALLGVVRNNAASNFGSLHQIDNKVVIPASQVLSNGNSTIYSEIMTTAINTVVPATAKKITGFVSFERNGVNWDSVARHAYIACGDTGIGEQGLASFNTEHDTPYQELSPFNITLTEAQSMAYKVSHAQTKLQIYISGWEY